MRTSTHFSIGTQAYGWSQIAQREGRDWDSSQEWAIEQAQQAGVTNWEPLLDTPEQVNPIAEAARRRGMGIHSIYMGGNLHDREIARGTIANMFAIAREAATHGTRLAVVNPNPIDWSSKADKSDSQLAYQLEGLNELAQGLHREGVTLCYHTHDAEMRQGAREFHHMLLGSDPALVKLCLDPHWVYRGAGDSQLALLDIITLYGDRIAEIHVRQSRAGIWDESVGPGDLDYASIVAKVAEAGVSPFIVIEHALETGTPNKLGNVEAHRQSRVFIEGVFAPLVAAN
jgi:inosose dehydratase